MNEKLMKIPYGKDFEKVWNDYVQFMKENNRDASIKSQNWVLQYYLDNNLNEQETILTYC